MPPDPSFKKSEARIDELEFVVTHLQKTIDALNEAVLLQQKRIDSLSRQIDQAKVVVQSVLHGDTAPRTLADDKPPHY
jgi:uncharacterized coiled-coil protein SlyX